MSLYSQPLDFQQSATRNKPQSLHCVNEDANKRCNAAENSSTKSIHVEIVGKGDPIVFFHGWGFDHRIWLPLRQILKKDYQVYLVDLPGSGLSTPMNWGEFKEKLLHLLPNSFTLVAWSLGGLFATRLALECPLRIKQLINVASSPHFLKEKNWPGIDAIALDQLINQMRQDPQTTLSNFLNLHSILTESTPYAFSSNFSNSTASNLTDQLNIFSTWDLRPSLTLLTPPTYYLFGRHDRIVPRTLIPIMKKKYPQLNYYLFEQAAHAIFLSHESEFINVLKRLLI